MTKKPNFRRKCVSMTMTGYASISRLPRPTEALEVSAARIDTKQNTIVFRTLKKRKYGNKGRIKKPHFRPVPVPAHLIEKIYLVFDLRERMQIRQFCKPNNSCVIISSTDNQATRQHRLTG